MTPADDLYYNRRPDELDEELATARRYGVTADEAGSPDFYETLVRADGLIKWAILPYGILVIIPKFTNDGTEMYHPVLARGGPVCAAGEAEIDVMPDGSLVGRYLDGHSGHYHQAGWNAEQLGRAAFEQQAGIIFP